ncbi:hypothetical protein OJ998_21040 [Solirubrobacter taibaiensis]|nr:hypothetical protein [Solirubrobacter taibaiensis]
MKLAALAIAGCPIFPASSPWNQRVDDAPVHPRSTAMVQAISAADTVHPDFGSGTYEGRPIGIPFQVVAKTQKRSRVTFEYADESDKGPYPIPAKPKIEGGGDRHLLLVQRGSCRLFELFAAEQRGRAWHAGSGAIFNLRSNKLRPKGWTSADAAGLPILPGLARYDEVERGEIKHALRFTVSRTRNAFVFPARHFASDLTDPDLPAMGQRFRLKASVKIDDLPGRARVIATALKRYGMLVADNGSNWFISGAPDAGWDNDALRALKRLRGADFEAVR